MTQMFDFYYMKISELKIVTLLERIKHCNPYFNTGVFIYICAASLGSPVHISSLLSFQLHIGAIMTQRLSLLPLCYC